MADCGGISSQKLICGGHWSERRAAIGLQVASGELRRVTLADGRGVLLDGIEEKRPRLDAPGALRDVTNSPNCARGRTIVPHCGHR